MFRQFWIIPFLVGRIFDSNYLPVVFGSTSTKIYPNTGKAINNLSNKILDGTAIIVDN